MYISNIINKEEMVFRKVLFELRIIVSVLLIMNNYIK